MPSLLQFELRSLDEPETHSLQRYAGKPLLMVFFQPECNWCLRQFRTIRTLTESCNSGFATIAVGVHGNRQELKKELRRLRADVPAYQSSPILLESVGSIEATPLILVGDSEGLFVDWMRGYIPDDQLTEALEGAGLGNCTA